MSRPIQKTPIFRVLFSTILMSIALVLTLDKVAPKPVLAESGGPVVTGRLVDAKGQPVVAAHVLAVPSRNTEPIAETESQEDGSWRYPAWKTKLNEPENYNLLETYRQLGFLVEKYGFTNGHEVIKKAAEYSHRIGAAPHTGINASGESPSFLQNLLASFLSDN